MSAHAVHAGANGAASAAEFDMPALLGAHRLDVGVEREPARV